MDDYNVNVLSEAKMNILSIIKYFNTFDFRRYNFYIWWSSILYYENNEESKYLMTFQNFLTRVPKWNTSIIEEETKRIVSKSECPYLTDLLTCVHITQLKVLTSIRVSQKQKKIDIDIPKLHSFSIKFMLISLENYIKMFIFMKKI